MHVAAPGITLRPSTHDDDAVLRAIYASTRAAEMDLVPWTDEEKQAFVTSQFDLQDAAYKGGYDDARFLMIERDGVAVGRLYLAWFPGDLHVIDIALLPEHRGAGIGSALMGAVLAEADAGGLSVSLYVERWNPARRLYERLGFEYGVEEGVYVRMERPAQTAP
ncbi:MAG TPA: GNAT family N-acetyltransferase [Acidimicrobiales bacterium]|nr:GNAT family N-acetyltransferase [Acidimicrobiales bacterium]